MCRGRGADHRRFNIQIAGRQFGNKGHAHGRGMGRRIGIDVEGQRQFDGLKHGQHAQVIAPHFTEAEEANT